jgi:PAS domain S-box-containing protein
LDVALSLSSKNGSEHRKKLRVVLPYLIVGALWIYASDRIVGALNLSPELQVWWSTLKGFGFLGVTGALLWLTLARLLNELEATAQRLQQSEAGYQDLYENAPDIYLTVDAVTGQVRQCNQAMVQATGFTKAEILGQPVSALYHPDCGAMAQQLATGFAATGEVRDVELQLRRKDGARMDVSVNMSAIRVATGQICYSRSVWRDITERKRTERALLESNARWQFALEGAGDGVWDWNAQTNRVFYSARWKTMLGFAAHEIGDTLEEWEQRVHPDDQAQTHAEIALHLAGQTELYTSEHRLRCKDGSYKWILDRGKVLDRTADGKPLRIIGTHSDITRRKQAEAAVEERLELETRLSKLAAHIPGAIYTFRLRPDGSMHLPFASASVQEIFGARPVELSQDAAAIFTAVHPDDRKALSKSIADSARTLARWHAEFRVLHPRKGEIWIEARSTPEREVDGCILWHGFVHEVTDRKQSEERVRKLSRAVEQSPAAVVITDLRGTIEYVNPKFTQLTGYSWDEAIGNNPRLLKSGETASSAYRELWRTIKSGREWRGEFHNKKKNGELFWESASISPVRDAQEVITHFIAVKEDITAQRLAEARIQEQAALLDQTQDAVLVMNLQRRITYCNQSAAQFYGRTPAELHETASDSLLFPLERERCEAVCLLTLERGGWFGEIHTANNPKLSRCIQSRWTRVHLADGSISFLITNTDITEKFRLEQQFLRAQRMESLGKLASGVAHDLNNILAPILMSIDYFRPLAQRHGEKEMLSMLHEGCQRGADIVRQLLIFGRGLEGVRAPFQVRNVLSEIATVIRETFPKTITLETSFPPDLWTIHADPTQIHQVVLNLCVNARDAMPRGGVLTLTAANLTLDEEQAALLPDARAGRFVLLQTTDTGTGMTEEVVEKIFDPFFTTKDPGKGTGLGLSTVSGIVRSHAGFLRVQTAVGSGTRFEVYLPALEGQPVSHTPPPDPTLPKAEGKIILLVDDEDAIRAAGQRLLSALGYRVLLARNGAEGIVKYSKRRRDIQVVITDLSMPVMDGTSLIRVLRQLAPEVPIIAMSGLPASIEAAASTRLLANAFLAKPFTPAQLVAALQKVSNSHENHPTP